MGTFYLGFERDDALPGLRKDVQIATADIDRVAAAYGKLYFPHGVLTPGTPGVEGQAAIPYQPAVPPTLDEDGNVIDPGQPEVLAQDAIAGVVAVPDAYRAPTGEEVFNAMANGLLEGILANTTNVEKTEAAKSAQDSVPPIVVTPENA